jgi:hypothetical protein
MPSPGVSRAGRGWWNRPAGRVQADVGGEDLDDRGLVGGGVTHQPFEAEDAAEPHVDLVGAKLFDSLGVPVGQVAFPAQPVGASRVGEADTGAERRPGDDQAGAGVGDGRGRGGSVQRLALGGGSVRRVGTLTPRAGGVPQ